MLLQSVRLFSFVRFYACVVSLFLLLRSSSSSFRCTVPSRVSENVSLWRDSSRYVCLSRAPTAIKRPSLLIARAHDLCRFHRGAIADLRRRRATTSLNALVARPPPNFGRRADIFFGKRTTTARESAVL